MITNKVLTQNDGKGKNVVLALDFEKQYRLSRFLSKNDAKRIFRCFDLEKQASFAEKMMQNTFCSENVVLAPDLENQI